MRMTLTVLITVGLLLSASLVFAELQTVTTDGSIRIRANYYNATVVGPGGIALGPAGGAVVGSTLPVGAGLRWPGFWLPFRPIGTVGNTVASVLSFDDDESALSYIEQRTRLGFRADFTNQVAAYIELDSYDIWGEDFRSSYITGADGPGASVDDVEIYQSYIEANEMFDYPLRLRVGRQEMSLGSGWLVGTNDTASLYYGLSFDGVRLTYATDVFSVDAFATKLAENSPIEEDGDVNLYGIYGSYLGIEDITLDAYWLWLRDARSLNDTNFIFLLEWLEDVFNVDDYDVTDYHTIGLRGAGTYGQFDFEAEVAYQWGEAGQYGFMFKPFATYGDDNLDHSEWAMNLDLGYTFDMQYTPRVYLGFAYFGGEDKRDINFVDWINPFDRPEGSTSFNRLFSNYEYSKFLDNTALSNVWILNGGVSAQPTETVKVNLGLSYLQAIEEFDVPVHFNLGRYRIPIAPVPWSFWTSSNDDALGFELDLSATYDYSEDLSFEAGWAHLFVGDGLKDGNFVLANGTGFAGGSSDDDADYLYVETKISF